MVIDPCAGSGSTLRACAEIGRSAYGFEVSKQIYKRAKEEMLIGIETNAENKYPPKSQGALF